MRQLALPVCDDEAILDGITAAKDEPRRTLLEGLRDRVLGAYATYVANAPALEGIARLACTVDESAALVHAYNVETRPFAELRARLMSPIAAAQCPLCGFGESATLDHYLPKERNPEFAVYSKNLIPCCGPCNTRKSSQFLDPETNARRFLHPYYDRIPNAQFVAVEIELQPSAIGIRYSIVMSDELTVQEFVHLESHFRRLGLAQRYRIMALSHLRDTFGSLSRTYGSERDAERVSLELQNTANDFEQLYGRNHWLSVLYRALAVNREFCDGGFSALAIIQ